MHKKPTDIILVVEDDWAIAEAVQVILEDEGYTVLSAHDGHQALTALQTVWPQMIISDIKMPGMDGIGLCQAIQTHPTHAATPVVLMSANTNRPDHSTCAYAAFIIKPFSIETLVSTVARVITAS